MSELPIAIGAAEAAYRIGVGIQTLNDMVRLGRLRIFYRKGRKRLFHPADVERARIERLAHPPSRIYRGVPRGR